MSRAMNALNVFLFVPLASVLAVLPAACSDPAHDHASTSDAGGSDAASGDASSTSDADAAADAAAACNALTTEGLEVSKIHGVAGDAPAAVGGTIEDGTYVLVQTLVYNQPSLDEIDGSFRKVVIAGSVVQSVIDPSPDRSLGDRTATETWTATGDTLSIQKTCPTNEAARTVKFTVETPDSGGTRLVIHGNNDPSALVFVKQ
jgi:hypothetical protein